MFTRQTFNIQAKAKQIMKFTKQGFLGAVFVLEKSQTVLHTPQNKRKEKEKRKHSFWRKKKAFVMNPHI